MSPAARPALRLASAVAAPDRRPALVRLCAGEPVALAKVDMIAFVNSAYPGLDPDVHPDNYTVAEIALERFHSHVGTFRRTKGDRATGIASDLTRYVIPFAVELAAARPPGRRGIAHLRVPQAEQLQSILAGDHSLPAATVAGDRLGRVAITCLWLTLADAARVCAGGVTELTRAMADGRLSASTDRSGQQLVFAADLRAAGLLDEPDRPHGLAKDTAAAIIKLLSAAIERGRDLGAALVGNYTTLRAVEPLASHRQRPKHTGPRPYTGLSDIVGACTLLTATSQLATWLMRLVGLRIGEAYGIFVADFADDGATPWLRVTTQGGKNSLARDEDGQFVPASAKDHTKTTESRRKVPICRPLADLISEYIRIFHTDPVTGQVNTGARLIAGLRSENDSGIAALRSSIESAFQQRQSAGPSIDFDPHDLRRALITDLTNSHVDRRVAEWYVGHAAPKNVHDGYDLGPPQEQLEAVAEAIGALVEKELDRTDLRVPTMKSEQWGRSTRRGRDRDLLRAELRETGWLISRTAQPAPDAVCAAPHEGAGAGDVDAPEFARRAGVSRGTARGWMRDGALPAQETTWGGRTIWTARPADVDTFLAARAGATVHDVALELGWTYTQTWALLVALRLTTGQRKGTAIRLCPADVAAIRAEVARRAEAGAQVLLVADAAQRLNLPDDAVGTLLRQGTLLRAPAPDNTRHRYVTLASVDAFAAAYPPAGVRTRPGDLVVPVAAVRRILGVTRPMMTQLVSTRQLCAITAGRRQCITMSSLQAWLAGRPIVGAQAALKEAAMALPHQA